MTNSKPGDGLTDELLALVAHVTSQLGEASRLLTQQAAEARIVRYSPTMIDVEVSDDLPLVRLDDGPTPGQALVYDRDQLIGEVLVWVRSGLLIGLEQAWYTDEPPARWPSVDSVRVS